jgi:hypothetical protein
VFEPEGHIAAEAECNHVVAEKFPHADDVCTTGSARFADAGIREMEEAAASGASTRAAVPNWLLTFTAEPVTHGPAWLNAITSPRWKR